MRTISPCVNTLRGLFLFHIFMHNSTRASGHAHEHGLQLCLYGAQSGDCGEPSVPRAFKCGDLGFGHRSHYFNTGNVAVNILRSNQLMEHPVTDLPRVNDNDVVCSLLLGSVFGYEPSI